MSPYLRPGAAPRPQARVARRDLPGGLEEAYLALAARMDPARVAAWKLGGTNAGSRAAFGVTRSYYGAVLDDEVAAPGAPLPPLNELKGEVEVALRLGPGAQGWDAWCVALEMPSAGLADVGGLGVVALVADRCAAGALVLGPAWTGPLPGPGVRLGQAVSDGRTAEGLVGDLLAPPDGCLAEFLALARSHGVALRAGQWVATGGVTACIPYALGDRVAVTLDGRAELEVPIDAGPA